MTLLYALQKVKRGVKKRQLQTLNIKIGKIYLFNTSKCLI